MQGPVFHGVYMQLTSSHNIISGLPVRDLIKQVSFQSKSQNTDIALSMLFGTTKETINARKHSHLTHSNDMDHQIRFPLRDRVNHSIKKLSAECALILKEKNINSLSTNYTANDYTAVTFFDQLANYGIDIQNDLKNFKNSTELLSEKELNILSSASESDILNYARERVYSGDYQTAYNVLSNITNDKRTDSINHLLGLCCNFFNRTEESEIHFNKMLSSQNILSQIKATYVLSMLYLRLHPKEMQDLEKAEKYLELGHKLIEENTTISDYYFHSVFNRNGYALCLFRRGKVFDALKMLDNGIQKLQLSNDGAKDLHKSVLEYNAVQCLKALQRYQECEKRCKYLISIDPLFPEYKLELAAIYLEQKKWPEALEILLQAEKQDPDIAETYALRGYLFLEKNELNLAIIEYRKANEKSPHNAQFKSDLEYCLELKNCQKV